MSRHGLCSPALLRAAIHSKRHATCFGAHKRWASVPSNGRHVAAEVAPALLTVTGRALPPTARIIEVGPRDGLQTARSLLPTRTKVDLIRRLGDCGVSLIDAAAFVNPKWNPKLGDGVEVVQAVLRPGHGAQLRDRITALVPNPRGLDRAIESGISNVSIWLTGSEAFSAANLNMSIAKHSALNHAIVPRAIEAGLKVRGYVSGAVICPVTGDVVDSVRVANQVSELLELGCYEVSLYVGSASAFGTRVRSGKPRCSLW
jgi:hydroxymethylglutaryl-CoA lyase